MFERYGLHGTLRSTQGKGKELATILLEAAALMQNSAGCLLYVVSASATDPDLIHIMEVWDSEEDHDISLQQPAVRSLIGRAMPILEDHSESVTLRVLGGKGLNQSS